ncbi:MAG: hypothetical protein K2J77_12425 [Oscillospiraceae bacterium]|nr:hypothetical protein [Oscillospiraceae bacterium]
MEKIIDIEDKRLGILNGRDCIYIDTVTLDSVDSLTFTGEINGRLASKIRAEKWIPYTLVFHRVIAHFACELDTYENLCGTGYLDHSDFTAIENSERLEEFPIREDFDKSIYKHFRVFTYDVVFDIFAVDFELKADLDKMNDYNDGSFGVPVES